MKKSASSEKFYFLNTLLDENFLLFSQTFCPFYYPNQHDQCSNKRLSGRKGQWHRATKFFLLIVLSLQYEEKGVFYGNPLHRKVASILGRN